LRDKHLQGTRKGLFTFAKEKTNNKKKKKKREEGGPDSIQVLMSSDTDANVERA